MTALCCVIIIMDYCTIPVLSQIITLQGPNKTIDIKLLVSNKDKSKTFCENQ